MVSELASLNSLKPEDLNVKLYKPAS